MIKKVKRLVKSSRILYRIYYYLGSFFLRILGMLIKTDDNLILFVAYGGQRYDDSPRAIYEYMCNHSRFSQFTYMWAFVDPAEIEANIPNKIKIDTISYYIYALKAKYWITNSSVSRGLNFKKTSTVNILFQHGMAGIKKIGDDLSENNKSFSSGFYETFDYIFIEGKKESEILTRAWKVNKNQLITSGLPRNDELVNFDPERIAKIKNKLNIPKEKKGLLYAPTFREYERDKAHVTYLSPPFDYMLWKKMLGKDFVLLITAHYEVERLMNLPVMEGFIINAFKYPFINDLILISDILISDYSSIIFDYSITCKPIISYAYDYEMYKKERGLYPEYETLFSKGVLTEQIDVIEHIRNMNYEDECRYTKEHIRDRYICNYGNATERAVKMIFG